MHLHKEWNSLSMKDCLDRSFSYENHPFRTKVKPKITFSSFFISFLKLLVTVSSVLQPSVQLSYDSCYKTQERGVRKEKGTLKSKLSTKETLYYKYQEP